MGGHGKDGDAPAAGQAALTDAPRGVIAVHDRHLHIHQNHVEILIFRIAVHGVPPILRHARLHAKPGEHVEDHILIELVVLHHKDPLPNQIPKGQALVRNIAPGAERTGITRRNVFSQREGQLNPERTALVDAAPHGQRAAHEFHKPLADGKPEPRAAETAGGGFVHLHERAENAPYFRFGDADAAITDHKLQPHARVGGIHHTDAQADRPLVGKLHGVVAQIEKDLPDAQGVAHKQQRHIRGDLQRKLKPFPLGFRKHYCGKDTKLFLEIKGSAGQFQLVGLDLGQIKDIVEDAEQGRARFADPGNVFILLRGQIRLQGQIGKADDRVHGRPQLVAHVGEEG